MNTLTKYYSLRSQSADEQSANQWSDAKLNNSWEVNLKLESKKTTLFSLTKESTRELIHCGQQDSLSVEGGVKRTLEQSNFTLLFIRNAVVMYVLYVSMYVIAACKELEDSNFLWATVIFLLFHQWTSLVLSVHPCSSPFFMLFDMLVCLLLCTNPITWQWVWLVMSWVYPSIVLLSMDNS